MSITFNDFLFFFFFLFALLCFIFVVWCSGLYFCEISFSYFALFRTFDQKAFATWYSRTLRDFFFSGLGGEKKLKSLTRFRSRSPSLRVKSRRQSESFYKCSQGIRALCTWGKNTKKRRAPVSGRAGRNVLMQFDSYRRLPALLITS